MNYLVTGGAGFIGSNLVHQLIDSGNFVTCLDKMTYAGNRESLADLEGQEGFSFIQDDIADGVLAARCLEEKNIDGIFHLAAESHVDRSIDNPEAFIQTNIVGTYKLLNYSLEYWKSLEGEAKRRFRFIHISTDEVYGTLGSEGFFNETTAYAPNSPYSATKAASDHLVRAYNRTYGLPTIVTNCSNNYGPYQFPEKLIPLMINNAISGKVLPIYGDGQNIRDWLYVEEHCQALLTVMQTGVPGETYNIGGNSERTNIEIVHTLCYLLDEMKPRPDGKSYREQLVFVPDRPGHDRRYAIDGTKIRTQLGWEPKESFETGIWKTVRWYLDNRGWVERILNGSYQMERLGLGMSEEGVKCIADH